LTDAHVAFNLPFKGVVIGGQLLELAAVEEKELPSTEAPPTPPAAFSALIWAELSIASAACCCNLTAGAAELHAADAAVVGAA
jgi:hypothetical protein